MSRRRHRRRGDDSDEDVDSQFLFESQESTRMSRQSSLRSHNSLKFLLQDSQESQQSQKSVGSQKTHLSIHSQESQNSVSGIPREFDYIYRSSQNDDHVLGLEADSPVSLSIGVVCVVEREESNNNPEIKPHTLQKTFYSYPKNCDEHIKKQIQDRIENDVADFKIQGYRVITYTFGLPFVVDEICNISRGYDGKTKMLRASRKNKDYSDEAGPAPKSVKKARK